MYLAVSATANRSSSLVGQVPDIFATMSSQPERHINNFSQLFPPKPHWTAADVPDLSGRTIIVTGGSLGLGAGERDLQGTARVCFHIASITPLMLFHPLVSFWKGASAALA